MRLAWLSDIHLNYAEDSSQKKLASELQTANSDIIIIGGDIAEAKSVGKYLTWLVKEIQKPIYFVLGNHDYYGESIASLRKKVSELSDNYLHLNWIPRMGVIPLTSSTALIGHGSWADGRLGSYMKSDLLLTDFFYIQDFNSYMNQPESDDRDNCTPPMSIEWITSIECKLARLKTMMNLADEAVKYVDQMLPKALSEFKEVIFLTHVPPFKDACWHVGKIAEKHSLPYFSCKSVGDKLNTIMKKYINKNLTVLCGHTHSGGEVQIAQNIRVYSATVRQGEPCVQRIFCLED